MESSWYTQDSHRKSEKSIESTLSRYNRNKTAVELEEFVLEAPKKNVTSYSNISAWSMKKISHRSLSRIEKESGIKTGYAEQFSRECLKMNSQVI